MQSQQEPINQAMIKMSIFASGTFMITPTFLNPSIYILLVLCTSAHL